MHGRSRMTVDLRILTMPGRSTSGFVMHGRSRMTVDPRILTMPGRGTSGFRRPGRHCLHQAPTAVRNTANRMKGELHPTKNRL